MATETKAKERPVIFTGDNVRAIMAGRKTQTRRVVSQRNSDVDGWLWKRLEWDDSKIPALFGPNFSDDSLRRISDPIAEDYLHVACRPHQDDPQGDDFWTRWRVSSVYSPGDRLWVKEKWALGRNYDRAAPSDMVGGFAVWYGSDDHPDESRGLALSDARGRWRSPIHMPRWASRLTLEITDVRVERLCDISQVDAYAEGCDSQHCAACDESGEWARGKVCEDCAGEGHISSRQVFRASWDSINAKRPGCSWADNPFVWCISFKPLHAGEGR